MNAFIRFNKGLLRLPLRVKLFLAALMTVNMLAPLYYWGLAEAPIVLATFMASFMLMVVLTARVGFTRLLGLGHILWIPLITYLITRMPAHSYESDTGIWIRSLILLNAIALVLDAIDVVRYVRGDRDELAPNLG